jgi:two-component system response regulator Irr
MKIIILEDDEMLRLSLTFYLKSAGIQIIEFDNGADGIAYIQKEHKDIDLVITDLNLPFADGQHVIMAIKAIKNVTIKIIVLTSSGIESSELESFRLGADDFISKPFSPAVMKTRINKLLGTNA